MDNLQNLDAKQIRKLTLGAASIIIVYCLGGLIHQYLIVYPYKNMKTGQQQVLEDRAILVFFPAFFTWLVGNVYNKQLPNPVTIPQKNSFYCGAIVFISTITYTWAIAKTSFPVVMSFKSCNLLSVIIVAVLCTRVKEKKLNLGQNKILVGLVVTIGVFLFSYFDPEVEGRTQQSQFIGILMLTLSLVADGFLPDFQAQIKSTYKPQPTEMMEQINKYVALISLASIIGSLSAVRVTVYLINHPTSFLHLFGISFVSCVGQFIVYYMIKQFKQHIVPFIITLRKLLTIVISIVFYSHPTSSLQILGIIIVAIAVVYEFLSEVESKSAHRAAPQQNEQKSQLMNNHIDESEELTLHSKSIFTGVEKGNFKI